jgi:DNA-binding NtrC family response regulator
MRVIASTERNLAHDVESGAFSRQLYDVLAVITIVVPPLRERREDIPLLVRYFVQRFNSQLNRTIRGVDEPVARMLHAHAWPGNVGELERVVKRACIVARSDVITAEEIGDSLATSRFSTRASTDPALERAVRAALQDRLVQASAPDASPFHDVVDAVESTLVREGLAITNGNQVKAADLLGVNRATLRKKMPPGT